MTGRTPKKAAPVRRRATKKVAVGTDTATPDPAPETAAQRPVWDAGQSRQEYHARLHAWKVARRDERKSTP